MAEQQKQIHKPEMIIGNSKSVIVHNSDILKRRIKCKDQDFYGTIQYVGPLVHFTEEELKSRTAEQNDEVWLGIEWDEACRGRHNGTIKGHQYFECADGLNSGSMIKFEKADFGLHIYDGILLKYYKDEDISQIKESLRQMSQRQIQSQNQSSEQSDATTQEGESQTQTQTQTKAQSQIQKKTKIQEKQETQNDPSTQILANGKVVSLEFDAAAFFETTLHHKKRVEFLGFQDIWRKINDLPTIQELSLLSVRISDVGQTGELHALIPDLKVLSLEHNQLFSWDQVFQIGHELPSLQSISLNENILRVPAQSVLTQEEILIHSTMQMAKLRPMDAFKGLKSLICIDMHLTWKIISDVLPAFPSLEQLCLVRNQCNDTQKLVIRENIDLQQLKMLNLEQNNIHSFQGLTAFKLLPKLEYLILNRNNLEKLGKITDFQNVKTVCLNYNQAKTCQLLSDLSQFPNLENLRLKHNPIIDIFGADYVRQRAVAENARLKIINGSVLGKYERKDCEIFYMRKTFDDFFKYSHSVYYNYNLNDFYRYLETHSHPSVALLVKKYGNPYEMEQPYQPLAENQNLQNEKTTTNTQLIQQQSSAVAKPVSQHAMSEKQQSMQSQQYQKAPMMMLHISALTGPKQGQQPLSKKFPSNTFINNLKFVISKLMSVPVDEQVLSFCEEGKEEETPLDADYKSIYDFGVVANNHIRVRSNKMA